MGANSVSALRGAYITMTRADDTPSSSSSNALDPKRQYEIPLHIASGGDDQSIAYSQCTLSLSTNEMAFREGSLFHKFDASGSAVKGVKIIPRRSLSDEDGEDGERLYVASVGYDQRLSIWKIDDITLEHSNSSDSNGDCGRAEWFSELFDNSGCDDDDGCRGWTFHRETGAHEFIRCQLMKIITGDVAADSTGESTGDALDDLSVQTRQRGTKSLQQHRHRGLRSKREFLAENKSCNQLIWMCGIMTNISDVGSLDVTSYAGDVWCCVTGQGFQLFRTDLY